MKNKAVLFFTIIIFTLFSFSSLAAHIVNVEGKFAENLAQKMSFGIIPKLIFKKGKY